MTEELVDLSRIVSHALRHEPWLYELELDDEGWAPVDQVVDGLRSTGGRWSDVDSADLERMITASTKRRHEVVGDRIRALYGHSLPGLIRKTPAPPPAQLFHGTASATWNRIRAQGLLPLRRQYVHLSTDVDTAIAVGRRKSRDPILLRVNAAEADAAGVLFYEGNEMVWLADRIPPRFVDRR